MKTDTNMIAYLLHSYGFYAFFDFAAGAPYMPIDMKGTLSTFEWEEERALCYKDAVFISPHKYIGGPDTPGILLVRKELLWIRTPANVGGGIVFFVD